MSEGKGARVAFDPVGGETFAKLISALSFQGILYLYGALADRPTTLPALEMIAKMLVIKGHNIWLTSGDETRRKAAVDYITKEILKGVGALRPVIDRTFTVRRNGRGPSLPRAEWPVRQNRCHCLTTIVPPSEIERFRHSSDKAKGMTEIGRALPLAQRKLWGSTSIATLTRRAARARRPAWRAGNPCRSAERGALAARRKRWRLRMTAIGASAGPSRMISFSWACPPSGATRQFLAPGAHGRLAPACARALPRRPVFGRDDDRRETPERRQEALPPLLGLLRVEPFRVAGHERSDNRMLRLPCLQKRMARLIAAPGASGRLAKKLERALGRAGIGVGETDVGIDDADKGQKRKVMPLGDELRADDEVEGAARRGVELAAQSVDPARRIR